MLTIPLYPISYSSLWACPKKAVHPTRGKVQQKEVKRAVKEKEVVNRKWH